MGNRHDYSTTTARVRVQTSPESAIINVASNYSTLLTMTDTRPCMTSRDTQPGYRPCRGPRIRPTKQVAPGPLMSRLSLCAARYPHTSEVHAAGASTLPFTTTSPRRPLYARPPNRSATLRSPRRSGCGRSCAAARRVGCRKAHECLPSPRLKRETDWISLD